MSSAPALSWSWVAKCRLFGGHPTLELFEQAVEAGEEALPLLVEVLSRRDFREGPLHVVALGLEYAGDALYFCALLWAGHRMQADLLENLLNLALGEHFAVRDFLTSFAGEETDLERRKRLQEQTLASVKRFSASDRLTRDEAHERTR